MYSYEPHRHDPSVQEPATVVQEATVGIDIHDPVDLLSWLPFTLGFQAHESLVLINVHRYATGPGIGLVARVDLDDLHDPGAYAELAYQLAREDAHQVLCVIVSEKSWERTLNLEGPSGRALHWWLNRPDADPRATWLLSSAAFRCVECGRRFCCPTGGRPASLLDRSPVTAGMVFQGRSYAAGRDDLAAEVDVIAPRRGSASAAAARHARGREAQTSRWRARSTGAWLRLLEEVGGSDRVPRSAPAPSLLGQVLAGLTDAWVRDSVLLWVATGSMPENAEERERTLAALFHGRLRPVERRTHIAQLALTQLACHATRRWRAAPLATAAWVDWWSGAGARARVLLDRVHSLDVDHTLAHLLTSVLAAGIPPGWVGGESDRPGRDEPATG